MTQHYVAKYKMPGGTEVTVSAPTIDELSSKLGVCRVTLWKIRKGKKSHYKIEFIAAPIMRKYVHT